MTTPGRDQPDPCRVKRLLDTQAWYLDQLEGINRELRENLIDETPLAVIGQGDYARTINAE